MKNTISIAIFRNMLRLQLIATAVVTLGALYYGLHAGISGFIGGGAVILASFFASKVANRATNSPSGALLNILKAEVLKIFIIIAVLFLAFKFYAQILPPALLAGVAAAALISGVAIGKLNKADIQI